MYYIYVVIVLLVSPSPKFHCILLYDQPFSRYRPFWDKFTEDPMCITSFSEAQISVVLTPFRSTTSPRFQDTGNFETSPPSEPKMTLNQSQKYPYIYMYY